MIGGRKPTPTALKLVTGKKGRGINRQEPKFEPAAPVPPDELEPAARKHWDRLVADLATSGVALRADSTALAGLCDQLATFDYANEMLRSGGWTVATEFGEKASPFVQIRNAAWRAAASMLAEFGLTPSSRSRVKVGDPGEKKPAKNDKTPARFFAV